jgi:sugar lactone lactonase YvrE
LSFVQDGTLFVGRDPSSTGGATPVKIHRVDTNGTATEYGNSVISDPDAVVYDAAGTVSGVAGSVIVGGVLSGSTGRISAIRPNGAVVTLFESTSYGNPSDFAWDSSGRLVFVDFATRRVFTMTGGAPVPLFTISGAGAPAFLAIDSSDRIFTGSSDGRIRVHASNGSVIDDDLATFSGHCTLAFGRGGPFGTDLLVLDSAIGTLYRVDSAGTVTTIGTGFDADPMRANDIAIGPDDNLYMSSHSSSEILRIAPELAAVDTGVPAPRVSIRTLPNPFAHELTFELVGDPVRQGVGIFDATGRLVRTLATDGEASGVGPRSLRWDGDDQAGRDVGPGVYYVRLLGPAAGGASRVVRVR